MSRPSDIAPAQPRASRVAVDSAYDRGGACWRSLLLLAAAFVATGALWDVVQVVAWSTMWMENVETESAGAALATTLFADEMCSLCHVVESAKEGGEEDGFLRYGKGASPLIPLPTAEVAVFAPAVAVRLFPECSATPFRGERSPPFPPPREADAAVA